MPAATSASTAISHDSQITMRDDFMRALLCIFTQTTCCIICMICITPRFLRSTNLMVNTTPISDDEVEQAYLQRYLCYLGSQSTRRKHDERPIQIRHCDPHNDERVDHSARGPEPATS